MTALQLNAMNVQLWQNIGIIADSEPLMKRLCKYVSRLVKEKEDSTQMTKEEFYAKIEKAEEDYRQGKTFRMKSDEDLTTFLRRLGHDI